MFSIFKKNNKTSPLFLFNTKTKQKEIFKPLRPNKVSLYTCGPTVYNYAHLGNLRSYVFADVLKRTLIYFGYKVHHVTNITDVGHIVSDADQGEDKIEKATKKEGRGAKDIVEFYTQEFLKDLEALNIESKTTEFPRATAYIPEQIALIQKLEKGGFAYKTSDSVYFDTSKFPRYGVLGSIDLEGLQEGSRIESNSEKKNPTDFALWKISPRDEKRQQEWDSPWGIGFPGWHIECSAMAMKLLGDQIDIHTGGIDHIPVHHNNEIAQSESATGKEFVNFWMHNQFLNVSSGKMAKSEENFLRLESVVKKNINPLAYRYFLLQAHYRSPITFNWDALEGSAKGLQRLAEHVQTLPTGGSISKKYQQIFESHIADDLDTAGALALISDLLKDDSISGADKRATIQNFDEVLGLNLLNISFEKHLNIPENIKELAKNRQIAREAKDWQKADQIRDQIEKQGFLVNDDGNSFVIQKK